MELAHLGYVVKNIERSLARFEKEGAVLTLAPTPDPIQRVSVALLTIDGAVDIELVAPLVSGDSPVESRLARGGGLDHVCYYVDDVEQAPPRKPGGSLVARADLACAFNCTIAFVQRRGGQSGS